MNVLTVNYDNIRSSANLNETTLNPSNVHVSSFGLLYSYPVDGEVYAQPLYASGIQAGGKRRNLLFVASMHNSVYAFDADSPPENALVWTRNLGPSVPNEFYNFGDIEPEVGILSTPVIDLASGTIYLVANTLEGSVCSYQLHALDLATGEERFGAPMVIAAGVAGSAPDSVNGQLFFHAEDHLQRPGLLLLNGVVYLAFGSHGDELPYHGWIMGYNASTLKQVSVFNASPNGEGGSVWQAGHGISADDEGYIYAVAANGDYDGQSNWGETFLKLDAANGLSVTDWFTPDTWQNLNEYDAEVGNSAMVLIPGTNLAVGGGKLGSIYLLDRNAMGQMRIANTGAVQVLPTVNFGLFARALWNKPGGPVLFVAGQGDPFKAYRLVNGKFGEAPQSQTTATYSQPYSAMAVSGDGNSDVSAILWVTTSDQTGQPVPGALHAFVAADLSTELWNSDVNTSRDQLGAFAKFAIPTVANGKVYVPTFSNRVAVYGLLHPPRPLANPIVHRPAK